jgi:hypothetical protein
MMTLMWFSLSVIVALAIAITAWFIVTVVRDAQEERYFPYSLRPMPEDSKTPWDLPPALRARVRVESVILAVLAANEIHIRMQLKALNVPALAPGWAHAQTDKLAEAYFV